MKAFFSNVLSRLVSPRVEAHLATTSSAANVIAPDQQSQLSLSRRSRKSRDTTEYEIGTEISGVVCGIEHYGLFIRLPNGESGLVFQSEICLPGEDITYRLGDKVNVIAVHFKPGRGLALSIRETLTKAAFDGFIQDHPVGSIIQGHIKSVLDYGIFVTLAPGVAGLLHVSAIPDIHVYGKSSIGEPIDVRVDDIEISTGRISLEFK